MDKNISTRKAYGLTLAELAPDHPEIVVLDADLSKSTMTCEFQKVAPQRHFNMGIGEQNLAAVSAGLATCGKTVFMSSFAAFAAGRAFEQVMNSICVPELNVKIAATHAGITVGEDGKSHQMICDLAAMRCLPHMKVYVPCDADETEEIIKKCIEEKGPAYIRLGRSDTPTVSDRLEKGTYLFEEELDICIAACGMTLAPAMEAADMLRSEGIKVAVINVSSVKPLNEELLLKAAKASKCILTCEEHNVVGGMGSAVTEFLAENHPVKVVRHGIYDRFGESGKAMELLTYFKLDKDGIYAKAKSEVK